MISVAITLIILMAQLAMRHAVEGVVSHVKIFYRLFLEQDFTLAALTVVVLLAAMWSPLQRVGDVLAKAAELHPRAFSLVCGLAFAAGSFLAYGGYPLSMDEYVPYLQSRIFASGRLTGSYPVELLDRLIPPAFRDTFIAASTSTGRIASMYLPGFALLLTPWTIVGLPWVANPVIGACAVLIIHRMVVTLTGSTRAAGTAALLTVASPAFSINAMSFYSMSAHLLCNAIFALLLLRPTSRRCLLAGVVGGLALNLHNPVPHVLFALPWFYWLAGHRERWRLGVSLLVGYAPWVFGVWYGWLVLLGSLTTAENLSTAAGSDLLSRLSFAVRAFQMPTAELLWARATGLAKLWLWAVPSVLVVIAMRRGHWLRYKRSTFLVFSAFATFIGYLFVPFDQGHGWGFRYFHPVWFVLPVLAACAFAPDELALADAAQSRRSEERYLHGCAAGSFAVITVALLFQVHGFIDRHLDQLPSTAAGETRVVIVDPTHGLHASDLIRNDPFLRDPVLRMLTKGAAEDAATMARHFPDLSKLHEDARGSVWGVADVNAAPAGRSPAASRAGTN